MADIHPDDQEFLADLRAALAASTTAQALAGGGTPDTLLEMIVRAAARAIPCPEGALLLLDHERRALTFEVVIGSTAEAVKDVSLPLGHGIAGLVAASGQALAVANAQDDPRHARDIAERSGYLPTTILAVPVTNADGVPMGVLELLDRQGQPTFSLADIDLLGMFAEQVATVLEIRRSHDLLAARLGAALSTLGGIPDAAHERVVSRAGEFAARMEADASSQRLADIAGLVASIASRGPAEHELCMQVLGAVDEYLKARPEIGKGLFR